MRNVGGGGAVRRARGMAAVLCAAAVLTGTAACRDVFAPPPCMPPEFTVSPPAAKHGEPVTVSAPDTTCDARYGAEAQVHVTVRDAAGATVVDALAPMNDDGGFSFVFTVPEGAAAGEGGVSAYPYKLDWCDDTGVNNRAVRGQAGEEPGSGGDGLVRVACAERVVPLLIQAG